jgi:hypothetical protein
LTGRRKTQRVLRQDTVGGGGKREEMTQTLYAHMNNKKKDTVAKDTLQFTYFLQLGPTL